MLMLIHDEQTVRLEDGRRLGYSEYGDPCGYPVFFFHGICSSRLHAEPYGDAAWGAGVRLISIDRPGYGLSDFQPKRRLLEWPNDVRALADHLGVRRFALLGHSAGGPHAAACAATCPEIVTAVALVSSPAPPSMPRRMRAMPWRIRLTFRVLNRLPWLARLVMHLQSVGLRRCPQSTLARMLSSFPEPDAVLVRGDAAFRESFLQATLESFRAGVGGSVYDGRLHQRAWGFNLNAIAAPVDLWYGGADFIVPTAMGRYLAQQTPNTMLRIDSRSGHLSTLHNNIEEILRGLVASPGFEQDRTGRLITS